MGIGTNNFQFVGLLIDRRHLVLYVLVVSENILKKIKVTVQSQPQKQAYERKRPTLVFSVWHIRQIYFYSYKYLFTSIADLFGKFNLGIILI